MRRRYPCHPGRDLGGLGVKQDPSRPRNLKSPLGLARPHRLTRHGPFRTCTAARTQPSAPAAAASRPGCHLSGHRDFTASDPSRTQPDQVAQSR